MRPPCHLSVSFITIQYYSMTMMKITVIFLITVIIPSSYSTDLQPFTNCSTLHYNCGSIGGIGDPFWGGDRPASCGVEEFELLCMHNQYTLIDIDGMRFRVLQINQSRSIMRIAREDLWNDICLDVFWSTRLNSSHFDYAGGYIFLAIFYGCTSLVSSHELVPSNITCAIDNGNGSAVFYANYSAPDTVSGCKISGIQTALHRTAFNELWDGTLTLQEALNQGFDVSYYVTAPEYKNILGAALFIIIIIGIFGAMVIISASIGCCCAKKLSLKSLVLWKRKTKNDRHVEALIRQHGSLAPKRYRYSDVKKLTNSLKHKLGHGGYGDVYKGKLPDGRLVAVKVLNASKGNGEEFINEVTSIGRTSHVNVVNLLGFCYESKKRALIYEFMPNGSLEKFIYRDSPSNANQHLGWEKLYQITLGIARGLEYLHRGCNTHILHLDIKPHNILLDEDFCPKISDFGLAKLQNRKESMVSMLEARGTIGYIAPEVFSRSFGGVSHKSDVYSYGMMVLEMVGGRKNIDVGVTHTSEIYFPHWIYRRLEVDENLQLQGLLTIEDNEIARKMILVGLWCIQTSPSLRPSMNKVIEMLEANIEALQIPPMPFLSSPPRSPADSLALLTSNI